MYNCKFICRIEMKVLKYRLGIWSRYFGWFAESPFLSHRQKSNLCPSKMFGISDLNTRFLIFLVYWFTFVGTGAKWCCTNTKYTLGELHDPLSKFYNSTYNQSCRMGRKTPKLTCFRSIKSHKIRVSSIKLANLTAFQQLV